MSDIAVVLTETEAEALCAPYELSRCTQGLQTGQEKIEAALEAFRGQGQTEAPATIERSPS